MKVDSNFPHKEIVDRIIRTCTNEGSTAILAGGFLRDHILGRAFKDLDFFIFVRKDNPYLFEEGLIDSIGFDFDTDTMEELGEKYDSGQCLKVTSGGLIYNFVQVYVEPTRYISNRFDYTINQVHYDGTAIKKSRAFIDTLKTRQVKTICPPNDPKRLEYLRAKFPEFHFPDLEERKQESLLGSTKSKKVKLGTIYDWNLATTTTTNYNNTPPNVHLQQLQQMHAQMINAQQAQAGVFQAHIAAQQPAPTPYDPFNDPDNNVWGEEVPPGA